MKAIVQNGYGSTDQLQFKEVEKPALDEHQVLVRVHATALNAGDLFSLQGHPWMVRFMVGFPRPKDYILGWDLAGTVEAVGSNVTRFQPGDVVYGACSHTLAEYALAAEDELALKPANLCFEEAAAVPTAAITALQGAAGCRKITAGPEGIGQRGFGRGGFVCRADRQSARRAG